MPIHRQLAFDLPVEPRYGRDDFLVSSSNRAAWQMFESWPEWPDRVMLLLGPTGAGKSHLADIWAQRAGVKRIEAAALTVANLEEIGGNGVVLENADLALGVEAKMFHLLNFIRSSGSYMVITARQWPDAWGVLVPDLLSRLRMAPVIEIGEPDDELVRAVLLKLFFDHQIEVDLQVVDYLALRIERSLDAARAVVKALDQEALERGRRITRPMAADVLRKMEGQL